MIPMTPAIITPTVIWQRGLRTSITTVYTASTAMENWPKRLAARQLASCTQVAYVAQKPTTEIASNVTEKIIDVRPAASAKSPHAKTKTSTLSTNIIAARNRRALHE